MRIRVLKKSGSTARIHKNSTVASTLNAMRLSVANSGYATLDAGWRAELLAAPVNRLYLVEKGAGRLFTNRETLPLEPGKAYLLPAGLPCGYECEETVMKLFFDFNLLKPNCFDLFGEFSQIAVTDISPAFLEALRAHYLGSSFADAIGVQSCVYRLLEAFCEKYGIAANAPATYSPQVADTIDYIQKNLSAHLRVDVLAERCFVSRTCLSESFRKEVGITLGRYIDTQLIFLAQRRLAEPEISIGTLSGELGFCSPFYFSQCFKKHCGLSPAQYRKRLLSKP